MKPPSQETTIVAAHECLADMPAMDLAKKLVEAQARCLDQERKLDEKSEEIVALRRHIRAAQAILETVVSVIGARDLLTLCEVVRCEILRRRGEEIPF